MSHQCAQQKWDTQSISLLGDRPNQQDSYGLWSDEEGVLALVADGVGGQEGGALAAQLSRDAAQELWQEQRANLHHSRDCTRALSDCLMRAHENIIKQSGGGYAALSGKCAVVLCYIDKSGLYSCAHVGDCRLYLCKSNHWEKMTIDDSLLEILLLQGSVRAADAHQHPDQGILTRALGTKEEPKPHVQQARWTKASALLLCSDGCWNQLPSEQWSHLLSPQGLKKCLLAAWDAKRGKSDNITAVLITLPIHPSNNTSRNRLLVLLFSLILLSLLLLICTRLT